VLIIEESWEKAFFGGVSVEKDWKVSIDMSRRIIGILLVVAILFVTFVFLAPVLYRSIKYSTSGDIEEISRINNKDDLSRLLGNIKLADKEIGSITVVGGSVYVFSESPDDGMPEGFSEDIYDWRTTPRITRILQAVGLSEDNVTKFGVKEGHYRSGVLTSVDEIREINWFQLDRNHDNEGNVLLVTDLPHPSVKVDITAIMSE